MTSGGVTIGTYGRSDLSATGSVFILPGVTWLEPRALSSIFSGDSRLSGALLPQLMSRAKIIGIRITRKITGNILFTSWYFYPGSEMYVSSLAGLDFDGGDKILHLGRKEGFGRGSHIIETRKSTILPWGPVYVRRCGRSGIGYQSACHRLCFIQ